MIRRAARTAVGRVGEPRKVAKYRAGRPSAARAARYNSVYGSLIASRRTVPARASRHRLTYAKLNLSKTNKVISRARRRSGESDSITTALKESLALWLAGAGRDRRLNIFHVVRRRAIMINTFSRGQRKAIVDAASSRYYRHERCHNCIRRRASFVG